MAKKYDNFIDKNSPKYKFKTLLGENSSNIANQIDALEDEDVLGLFSIISDRSLQISINKQKTPYGIAINTSYGTIFMENDFKTIDKVLINSDTFNVVDNSLEGLDILINGDIISNIGDKINGNKTTLLTSNRYKNLLKQDQGAEQSTDNAPKRVTRSAASQRKNSAYLRQKQKVAEIEAKENAEFEELQREAVFDLHQAGITYENFHAELSFILNNQNKDYNSETIMKELLAYEVPENQIPEFLAYGSEFKRSIVGRLYGRQLFDDPRKYRFKTVEADNETFLGKLLTRIDVEEAEYDEKYGTLKIGDRLITNLPNVDKDGVFHGINGSKYIPYHIGYFVDGEGSRIDRLRHIDPVERALTGLELQYKLTQSDVKFRTILDVSRNLPDFEQHPYKEEILEAYKNKIVIDDRYSKTNSYMQYYRENADELGATNTIMLDEDAKGLIDPYGTSNGANFGRILYLTKGSEFAEDGTLIRSGEEHSSLGYKVKEHCAETDNMNRHQMSFNALLTSVDVVKINVAYAEVGMFNSEDAVVITKNGAEKMATYHDVEVQDENGETKVVKEKSPMQTGDKVIDFHGNKSISSQTINPDMADTQAKEERLTNLVELARLNPDLDMVVSPVSLNSRLNYGVTMEGLQGAKKDLHLPDGTVVKNGIVEMEYMVLPQTAEYKSIDYKERLHDKLGSQSNVGRKLSGLFRNSLMCKTGEELYEKALLDQNEVKFNKHRVAVSTERLGLSFKDKDKMFAKNNFNTIKAEDGSLQPVVDAGKTISLKDLEFMDPFVIRKRVMREIIDHGSVNIDLGDIELTSPLTGKPIKDSENRNVLPLRNLTSYSIPLRTLKMYSELSLGNEKGIKNTYANIVASDYNNLVEKENLLKNIKTTTKAEGAYTQMIIPDPRIRVDECRTQVNDENLLVWRDPCMTAGNTMTLKNVGGEEANLMSINPLIITPLQADFDSDTMGILETKILNISGKDMDEFLKRTHIDKIINKYGEVNLAIGGSHFKAMCLVNDIDTKQFTFKDGKSPEELRHLVDDACVKIVDSPKSYGAYAIEFTDEKTVKQSLGKLIDDGIKGKHEDLEKHFGKGYTHEEDYNVMTALIAKSEMTGVAGVIANNLISKIGDTEFDEKLMWRGMDVCESMTQSVLQLKKNADKLPYIDGCIKEVKKVLSGDASADNGREGLHLATRGLVHGDAVDEFCDIIESKQEKGAYFFGKGVLNNIEMGNSQLAYANESKFIEEVRNMINYDYIKEQEDKKGRVENFEKVMADLENKDWYQQNMDELKQ